ncbi:MAG: ACT domain-containing protein, partial [Actinobacteria bacterium]|nr:ACT domain-containing protein [Actinomycetota bacterium]
TDISFTVPLAEGRKVVEALEADRGELGFTSLLYDDQIAKVAVVGAGMRTSSGVSAQLFRALFEAGINIEMISTSEIRISVVTHADAMEKAVRALHTAFGLDADAEATVYGGTGR